MLTQLPPVCALTTNTFLRRPVVTVVAAAYVLITACVCATLAGASSASFPPPGRIVYTAGTPRRGRFTAWPDRFAYLGHEDETTWEHQIILHRVVTPKRSRLWMRSTPPAGSTRRRTEPTWTSASMTSTGRSRRSRDRRPSEVPADPLPRATRLCGCASADRLGGHAGSLRKRVLPRSRAHRRRTRGARRSRRAWTRRRRSLARRRARRPTDRVSRAGSTARESGCPSWWSAGGIGPEPRASDHRGELPAPRRRGATRRAFGRLGNALLML